MAVNGYRKKIRGVETRKRKRFVFISAEGNNKTETLYLKSFNGRNIQIKPVTGKTTDPIKMSQDLIKKMQEDGFDSELGDLAYCFVDGDFESYKNRQISEADALAKKYKFKVVMSNPCFEIWYICHFAYTTKQYRSNGDVISELRKYVPDYEKAKSNMRLLLVGKECDALANAEKLKKYCIESGYSIHTVAFMPSTEMNDVFNELKDIANK